MTTASMKRLIPLIMMAVLAVNAGCSGKTLSIERIGELSSQEYQTALRWKRYKVAAGFMEESLRAGFRETFAALPDIHITDVRLIDQVSTAEGRHFTATYEMDYYILPSLTLKTFRYEQTWAYIDGTKPTLGGFLITTPFPAFP